MEEFENKVAENATAEGTSTSTQSTGKKSTKKTGVLVTVIVGVVLALVGGVAGFLYGNGTIGGELVEWTSDLEVAKISANDSGKDILLVFTGTEWDEISADVKTSILDNEKFRRLMGRDYELVLYDIPAEEDPFANDEIADWYLAAMIYQLETTPAFMLLNANGERYASISHDVNHDNANKENFNLVNLQKQEDKALKPSLISKRIDAIQKGRLERQKMLAKIDKTNGAAKVKLIDTLFEESPAEEQDALIPYLQQIPELDPNNESGLLGKYKLRLAYVDVSALMQAGDNEGAVDLFLSLAEEENLLNPTEKQEAYYMAGYVSYGAQVGTMQEVIDLLKKAYDAHPESENAQNIQLTIEQLTEIMQNPSDGELGLETEVTE